MGWLTDLTNWLVEQITALWTAIETFFSDMIVETLEGVLSMFVLMINALPVPDFLSTYSMNSLLGQAGGTILWLVGTFKVGQCLGIISAGYAFRLLRKLFTLGQW